MANITNGNYSEEETLQIALQKGIINLNEISARVEVMRKKEILSNHKYKVWQNKEGIWLTYLPDLTNNHKRLFRKRKTREELEDAIVEFYNSHQHEIYIKDVFKEWSESKLKYGELQKQSFDRYCDDFRRFFPAKSFICKKRFSDITYTDLKTFIKTTIHDMKLTRKSYSGLRLLIRGIFIFGKEKQYTKLSMTEFFGDLELPNNIFAHKIIDKSNEVLFDEEIVLLTNYLKENADIWNMGILLQLETGMRIGEIAALKPEDVHLHSISVHRTEVKYKDGNGKIRVKVKDCAKTGAGNREVYLSETGIHTVKQILQLNPDGEFLFMNRGKRIRENTFNKRLTAICNKLGIKHISTHKLRKTYGTALLDNNVPDSVVAEQMGHTDIETTRKLYYFCNKSEKTKIEQINNAIRF